MNLELEEAITFEDHMWLVELHNDPFVLKNITNPMPVSIDQHMSWYKNLNWQKEQRFIFYVDGVRAGFTKFYQIDRPNMNCVLGADLHKDFRGKGLAKSMWQLMLKKCFDELKLHRVSLTTASFNEIAQKVYVGLGFVEEGRKVESLYRDGVYFDEICMFLLYSSWIENVDQ